ncbi:AI-2E family transporter [Actinomycetospora cinnamomea]|nr:AI-2E family transporter [Actinomycetospora cinnamomea]
MSTSVAPPGAQAPTGSAAPVSPAAAPLPRGLLLLLGAAAVVVSVAGLMAVAWLVAPVLLALVIVIAVAPLQAWLRRKGWPAWSTVLALVLVIFGILLALVAVLFASVGQLVAVVPQYSDRIQGLTTSVSTSLARLGFDPAQARATAASADLGQVVTYVGSILADLSGAITTLVFLLALILFLIAEANGAGRRLEAVGTDRPHMVVALQGFAVGTRRYLVVTAVFGLIVAVLDTVALAIMGIPLVILWGLLSFITNFIPNIGFIIGLVPPALLGLLVGGWQLMAAVIVVYIVLNAVVQSLIQPRFTGDAVGLSAVVTFVALLFWAWVLGPLGALLAIPATLLVKAVLVDCDPGARWVEALIGSASPPGAGRGAGDTPSEGSGARVESEADAVFTPVPGPTLAAADTTVSTPR